MADVAQRAGVSHQTVSRVLNDSPLVKDGTRERVLAAIEELGYRRNNAARMLATNRSGRIGMVSAHLALHGPSMIASSVQDAGHEAGYEVSLVGLLEISDPESLRDAVDRLLDQAVEAIVVAVAHREALDTGARLSTCRSRWCWSRACEPASRWRPGSTRRAGALLRDRHLLDLGHRGVAHVTGPLRLDRGRLSGGTGWREAHEEPRPAARPGGRGRLVGRQRVRRRPAAR